MNWIWFVRESRVQNHANFLFQAPGSRELSSTEKWKTMVEHFFGGRDKIKQTKKKSKFSYRMLDLGYLSDIRLEMMGSQLDM